MSGQRSCYCWPGTARCDDPYNSCDRAQREAASEDDGLREAVAQVIGDYEGPDDWFRLTDEEEREAYRRTADAVLGLPELAAWAERVARERAAEELRAAAREVAAWPDHNHVSLLLNQAFLLDGDEQQHRAALAADDRTDKE